MSLDLINLKKLYLFDEETDLIREGLPMNLYAKILYTDDEEELESLIKEITEEIGDKFQLEEEEE